MNKLSLLLSAILAVTATCATARGPQIDQAALMTDVQTLASAPFAGRRTGSEGSKLAQAYITARFREIGLVPFGAGYGMPFSFTQANGTTFPSALNLVGHIRGSTHPERVLVVSAHYDHLGVHKGATYLGADDNASGVGAMLAVASYFKAYPPRNTIVFAAFDAEELGKRGANAFVKAPPFPIGQVRLNFNLDMVSRNDRNEIYAAGTSYTPALKALVAEGAEGSPVKVKLGHDRPSAAAGSQDDWTEQSDHAAFFAAGIPFLYFGVEDHADYHQPGDTADKINPVFYGQVTRLIVRTAAHLDQHLDRVR